VKLPTVLLHVACDEQLLMPVLHSSRSEQLTPLPVYPLLQVHVKLPVVLLQEALGEQLLVPALHSLTSMQPEAPTPPPL
jgi:hypothetical protein